MNYYQSKRKPNLYVTMLGDFSITMGKNRVSDHDNQSKKTWIILEYLVTFRKQDIKSTDLTGLIWGDDKSKNPLGALKTLVFRSRQLLHGLNYPPHNIVIQTNGSYAWNSELNTTVDVDIFEELANKALSAKLSTTSHEEILNLCLEALELYKGRFLSKSQYESWVIPISDYYHSLFLQLMEKATELLFQKEDYETIIEISKRAIKIERYEESLHYNLVYALYQNGSQKKALEHYTQTTDMYYNELTTTPSERFKSLYTVVQDDQNGITPDLNIVIDKLQETSNYVGAYYCEYSVFKDIYQLECRSMERTGNSIFIGMLSLSNKDGELFKPTVLKTSMGELGNAIRSSLRRGDVYTRFSISQYLFLLPTASNSNAEMILKRIIKKFKSEYSRKDMTISSAIRPLTPIPSEDQTNA